jgi:hypothetical protein
MISTCAEIDKYTFYLDFKGVFYTSVGSMFLINPSKNGLKTIIIIFFIPVVNSINIK